MALKKSSLSPYYLYITVKSQQVLKERLRSRFDQVKLAAKERRDKEKTFIQEVKHMRQKKIAERYMQKQATGKESTMSLAGNEQSMWPMVSIGEAKMISESMENIQDDVEKAARLWIEKASDASRSSDEQALMDELVDQPGFFDAIIVNDNLEQAYRQLKNYLSDKLEGFE
jgi:guanylate kinase